MSDQQQLKHLLTLSAAGNQSAFETLYKATSPKLFGYAIHMLQNREAAEDVMQIAFVKIWNNASLYDPAKSKPMSWLLSILRNSAIDELRKQKRCTFVDDNVLSRLESGEVSVLDRMERRELAAAAMNALQDVDPDKQAITKLAYLEDVPRAELSRRFNTPEGTIKTKLRRTLIALRETLEHTVLDESAT